jgi:hypothetical protein
MKINPFLTAIARDYNLKVEYVAFCPLQFDHFGEVHRRKSVEQYRILIDRERLSCPYSIIFTLFHEVGHVALGHLGYMKKHYEENQGTAEAEVDDWAFYRMGLIDAGGQVKEEHRLCYECHKTRSMACLKGSRKEKSCLKMKKMK